MPAAIALPLTSPAVSSQSIGVIGTSSTAFSDRLTPGASVASYNNDIAEMSRQQGEMLSLQIAMQRENLMFTSISNILKTKHDTLKNTVSNIR